MQITQLNVIKEIPFDFSQKCCRGAPTLGLMQITQLNVITETPFDFSQKYQTVPRPNRRATIYSERNWFM